MLKIPFTDFHGGLATWYFLILKSESQGQDLFPIFFPT